MTATLENRRLAPSGPPRPQRAARPSRRAIVLSALATLAIGLGTFAATVGPREGQLVWSDGWCYFLYARSLVVDHDTDLTREFEELDARLPAGGLAIIALRETQERHPATGRISFPWPIGMGLVMAPFYAAGYAVERVAAASAGRPADTCGLIPQYFFCLGSLAYGLLGFWCTLLLCRRAAGRQEAALAAVAPVAALAPVATVATLAVLLGGPVVFYVFFHPAMAHAASFGLTALLTLLWWESWEAGLGPRPARRMALLGLLTGLLAIMRYQNAVFGLLLLAALAGREARRAAPGAAVRAAVAGIATLLVPLAAQAAHHVAVHGLPATGFGWQGPGAFRFEQNEMDLRAPHLLGALFSCQHGAFYWAPVLAAGAAGLAWAARRESAARVLLAVLAAQVYVIGTIVGGASGAYNWSGGNSFGMRYLAECAPFLAFGLAAAMRGAARWIGTRAWTAVLAVLVIWNGCLVLAYGMGTIDREECVTWKEMAAGALAAAAKLLGRG